MKATIKSKGQYVPRHFHDLQDETFEVLAGKLTIALDRELKILVAGDKVTLRKNVPHNHYNNEDTEVTYIHKEGNLYASVRAVSQ